jgi:hypothetical protein
MLPEEVYKRRHFGTPESFFLITANYVILALAIEFFADCDKITNGFWITIGLLAAYNVYKVRFDRHEYDRTRILAYVISLAGMLLMFFLFRQNARHC